MKCKIFGVFGLIVFLFSAACSNTKTEKEYFYISDSTSVFDTSSFITVVKESSSSLSGRHILNDFVTIYDSNKIINPGSVYVTYNGSITAVNGKSIMPHFDFIAVDSSQIKIHSSYVNGDYFDINQHAFIEVYFYDKCSNEFTVSYETKISIDHLINN